VEKIQKIGETPENRAYKSKPKDRKGKIAWLKQEFKIEETPWLKKNSGAMEQTINLLLEFYDVFSFEDKLSHTDVLEHNIRTEDVLPIRMKGRPIDLVLQDNLRKRCGTTAITLELRLLRVPKKNDKIRCVDYRRLDDITVKISFPLRNIEGNLVSLAHSCVFSALDGAEAYFAVPIKEEDRQKTAFSTPFGLYQWR